MSYDYFLFAAENGETFPEGELKPIGTPVALIASISRVFPSLKWEPPQAGIDAWFGGSRGGPEVILSSDGADGNARIVKVAFLERDDVVRLARELGLAVFDPQSGAMLAP